MEKFEKIKSKKNIKSIDDNALEDIFSFLPEKKN